MEAQSILDGVMEEQSVIHSTFVVEHSYTTTPERVFAAFADPASKRRWYAERGSFDVDEFEMDFRVGGVDLARYRFKPGTPFPGTPIVYNTTYQDIVPDRRIVLAYTVTMAEKRISSSLATFEFLATDPGTNLIFTEQGAYFEGADGPAIRHAGWKRLLELLAEHLAR